MSHYTVVVVYLLSLCISSALFSQFPVGGGLMSHYTVVVVYLLSLCISSALFSQYRRWSVSLLLLWSIC